MIRGRLRSPGGEDDRNEDEFVEIDPSELTGLFAAPNWLRDAGFTAWLLVGVILLAVGVVWFLTLTAVIFVPVIVAGVIAAVGDSWSTCSSGTACRVVSARLWSSC